MKTFTVVSINGDYANLVDNDGEELFIAMALLPIGVDIGIRLSYENMEFSIID